MEKKEKSVRGRIALACVLFILLVLAVLAAVLLSRYYPVYRDAQFLTENLDLSCFAYELEAELDRGKLEEGQVKLLDTLAELTGVEQENMYRLSIRGSVDGDVIHATIYPHGRKEPLIELYLSDETDVVNCAMLYQAVRSHYAEESWLAALLFPEWNDHEFVSLEQLEHMLELDLEKMRSFQLPLSDRKFTVREYFSLLAVMERSKTGNGESVFYNVGGEDAEGSSRDGGEAAGGQGVSQAGRAKRNSFLAVEGLEAQIELDYASSGIRISIAAAEPSEMLAKLPEQLSGIVGLEAEKYRALKVVSLVMTKREEVRLEMPRDLISQRAVDIIAGIRSLMREISGK